MIEAEGGGGALREYAGDQETNSTVYMKMKIDTYTFGLNKKMTKVFSCRCAYNSTIAFNVIVLKFILIIVTFCSLIRKGSV